MIHNTDIFSLIAKVHKLKLRIDHESYSPQEKYLIQKYLGEVLDYLQEVKMHH
jgi:hypothetical protein